MYKFWCTDIGGETYGENDQYIKSKQNIRGGYKNPSKMG